MPQGNVGSESGVTSEAPVPSRQKQVGQFGIDCPDLAITLIAPNDMRRCCVRQKAFRRDVLQLEPVSHQAEVSGVRMYLRASPSSSIWRPSALSLARGGKGVCEVSHREASQV